MQEFEVKSPSLVQKTRLLSNSLCCVLARQTNCHNCYSRPRHLPIRFVAKGVCRVFNDTGRWGCGVQAYLRRRQCRGCARKQYDWCSGYCNLLHINALEHRALRAKTRVTNQWRCLAPYVRSNVFLF